MAGLWKKPSERKIVLKITVAALIALAALWWSGRDAPSLADINAHKIAPSEMSWIEAAPDLYTRKPLYEDTPSPLSRQPIGRAALPTQLTYEFLRKDTIVPKAILVTRAPGPVELYANGVPLKEDRNTSQAAAGQPLSSTLTEVPQLAYHPGSNALQIVLHDRAFRGRLHAVFYGPKSAMRLAHENLNSWNTRLSERLKFWAIALTITGLLFSIFSKLRWLGAFSALFGANLWTGTLTPDAGLFAVQILAQSSAQIALPAITAIAVIGMLSNFELHSRAYQRRLVFAFAGTVGISLIGTLIGGLGELLAVSLCAVAALVCASLIGRNILRQRSGLDWLQVLTVGTAITAALAISFSGLSSLPFSALEYSPTLSQFSVLGCIPLIIILSMRGVSSIWQTLNGRTTQLERQLEEQEQALQAEIGHRAVLEERQRLVRDMHDGIGGHLQSLLMRLRAGKLALPDVDVEVQSGINDLRLIVDSLDHVGDDLSEALATFRARARAQVEAVGMSFAWTQNDDLSIENVRARDILNIYRFMQEAVTNAVRHSGGDLVSVVIGTRETDRSLSLSITDNGCGLVASSDCKPGKGLRNLEQRARELNGVSSVESILDNGGARISLTAHLS